MLRYKQPLTFTAVDAGTVKFDCITGTYYQYKLGDDDWQNYSNWQTISLNANESVKFRALSSNDTCGKNSSTCSRFYFSGRIKASGNVMSLLDKDMNKTIIPAYCFKSLFDGCNTLLETPEINAVSVGNMGCWFMFENCTSLTSTPFLSADTCSNAYAYMFNGCTSLVDASNVHFNTAIDAYDRMFKNCTPLTGLPQIHITGDVCAGQYRETFLGCKSMTKMPVLSSKYTQYWADNCFNSTFKDCTSLTACDGLMLEEEYIQGGKYKMNEMFSGCSSLISARLYFEHTDNQTEFYHMFQNCTSLSLLDVNLTTFTNMNNSYWLEGVKNTSDCIIRCPAVLSSSIASYGRGPSTVPENWQIVYK